jgi:hypothetical protein
VNNKFEHEMETDTDKWKSGGTYSKKRSGAMLAWPDYFPGSAGARDRWSGS